MNIDAILTILCRNEMGVLLSFLLVCAWMLLALVPASEAAGQEAPLLPLPEGGRRVHVRTAEELRRAVENAEDGDVILVADGTYRMGRLMRLDGRKDIVIRGASDDPARVIIRGRDFDTVDHQDDILRIGACENVTVAYLTFTDCHAYGLKVEAERAPKNIHIYNCHFRDIGTRAIKGSGSETEVAVGGSVRHCHFENTKIPPADWQFEGNYITAIDMMALEDWTFSDNTFRNIRGCTGGGRGAIFVWVRSRRITVERNVIVNCDRGIAFGNPSPSTNYVEGMLHIIDSICRNNMIVVGPDSGVELAWVENVKVYNNTIWREDPDGRGIRCVEKIGKVDIANNLVRGAIKLAGEAAERNNLCGPLEGFFVDPAVGDLRLTPAATAAVDRGLPLPEVTEDADGQVRDAHPDIGASEYRGGDR